MLKNRPVFTIMASHPTQFEGPLYPRIARECDVDLRVYFWTTDRPSSLTRTESGIKPDWDCIPLTEGYSYHLVPSRLLSCWRFILNSVCQPKRNHVILINGWRNKSALFTLVAAFLRNIPFILRLDTVDLYKFSIIRTIAREAARSLIYRMPAAFAVTSSLSRAHLLRRGVRAERIFLFPYSIDNMFLSRLAESYRSKRAERRSELGIALDDLVIMSAVQFIPREGVLDLVMAYSELKAWHDSTVLLLVGDGPLRPKVESLLRQHNSMRVILTGWVPYSRLLELYAISDLFVHPAVMEPWGCSVQEAAACKLPLLVSDLVGSAHDLVRPGINGFIFKGGDRQELRNALESMLINYQKWPEMGEHSWAIVQDWGHERVIREIKEAMDFCLKNYNAS